MRPSDPQGRDEVLESNAGFVWLAVIFFAPVALLLFALSAQIGPVIPFSVGLIAILIVFTLERRRPTYPFRVLQTETPPEWLTVDQRRVLAFLKSADAARSRRRLCAILVLLTAGSTGLPMLLGGTPDWVLSYLRIPGDRVLDAGSAPALIALVFQAFATYCALFGWGCRQAVREWDQIQARYDPWPLNKITSGFRIVTAPKTASEDETLTQTSLPTRARAPVSPNMPVSGRQVAAVSCFLLGGAGVFIGATSLVRDFLQAVHLGREKAILDVGVILMGLVLVRLGRYLWDHGR